LDGLWQHCVLLTSALLLLGLLPAPLLLLPPLPRPLLLLLLLSKLKRATADATLSKLLLPLLPLLP
jgi:hypothetical protein